MVPEMSIPALTFVELFFDLLAPFFNVYLIFLLRKQVFHFNLRILIVNFSVSLIFLTLTRVVLTSHVIFSQPFPDGFLQPVEILHDVCVNNVMSIALPIVIERIVATAMVYRYETASCPWTPFLAIAVLWTINIFDCFQGRDIMRKIFQNTETVGDRVYVTASTSVLLFINAFGFVLFLILVSYNTHRFKMNYGVHSLTQRFQMAENIRTSRQLLKVIFINFVVNLFSGALIFCVVYLNTAEINKLLSQIFDLTAALLASVIPVVLIASHPKLSMDCYKLWITVTRRKVDRTKEKPTQTVNNQSLIVNAREERDVYFNQLSLTWK